MFVFLEVKGCDFAVKVNLSPLFLQHPSLALTHFQLNIWPHLKPRQKNLNILAPKFGRS